MSTLDVAVAVPKDNFTPQKNKSTSSSRALESISFLDTLLVQADDVLAASPSDPDTFSLSFALELTCYTCHIRSSGRGWLVVKQ